jgi:hypothetical protein
MNSYPENRLACAMLTCLVEPADPLMGRLLSVLTPAGVLASISSGTMPAGVADGLDQSHAAGSGRRWPAGRLSSPPSPRMAVSPLRTGTASAFSAPVTPAGRLGLMISAPRDPTRCGCAAPQTSRPAARNPWR